MFEGKEKRLDLTDNELRLVESWKGAGEEDQESTKAFEQLQEKALREGILEVEGAVLSQTLDTLSKELVRFQEEKRIAVMVKFAERHRRLRQANESGRRQAEERLRDGGTVSSNHGRAPGPDRFLPRGRPHDFRAAGG